MDLWILAPNGPYSESGVWHKISGDHCWYGSQPVVLRAGSAEGGWSSSTFWGPEWLTVWVPAYWGFSVERAIIRVCCCCCSCRSDCSCSFWFTECCDWLGRWKWSRAGVQRHCQVQHRTSCRYVERVYIFISTLGVACNCQSISRNVSVRFIARSIFISTIYDMMWWGSTFHLTHYRSFPRWSQPVTWPVQKPVQYTTMS